MNMNATAERIAELLKAAGATEIKVVRVSEFSYVRFRFKGIHETRYGTTHQDLLTRVQRWLWKLAASRN